jgi:hypothetical protein
MTRNVRFREAWNFREMDNQWISSRLSHFAEAGAQYNGDSWAPPTEFLPKHGNGVLYSRHIARSAISVP